VWLIPIVLIHRMMWRVYHFQLFHRIQRRQFVKLLMDVMNSLLIKWFNSEWLDKIHCAFSSAKLYLFQVYGELVRRDHHLFFEADATSR
jgi:hypothetical protein